MNALFDYDTVVYGDFLHCIDDPDKGDDAWQYHADSVLLLRDGLIIGLLPAGNIKTDNTEQVTIHDYRGKLVLPGFIDSHCHYPQTEVIASYGLQLLDWLKQYTFPTEHKFENYDYARRIAGVFCEQLLRNGTTTAMVYATIHPQSVDAIFSEAVDRNMCLIAGKVLMDRNAPDYLRDTAESGYEQSAELIERWHGKDRLRYAVTPRFAPCSSEQQLQKCGQLLAEYQGLYLQTHVAENHDEVRWVAELFPDSRSYLDVYDQFGLLGERSVYAHCIHLDDTDWQRMADSGATAAFCPTSNLFLGSGLFNLERAREHGLDVSLATDVGGGTSFSMLQTMHEAYKVTQMAGGSLSPLKALYLATLGGSRTLQLDDQIGSFEAGKVADFVVLDRQATELIDLRLQSASEITEQLFALIILGDDRCTHATHIMGKPAYLASLDSAA